MGKITIRRVYTIEFTAQFKFYNSVIVPLVHKKATPKDRL